jgi:hypothetical protein
MRGTWRLSGVAIMWLVVLSACAAPAPPATPTPFASADQPTPAASSGTSIAPASEPASPSQSPTTTSGPGPTPPPAPPSATDLILAGEEAGVIDEPTAILYRVYSVFGDDRLPEQYRGPTQDDTAALDIAMTEIATYPADVQQQLQPFLLRPTDPNSYWAQPVTAIAARALAATDARTAVVSPCVNGWITRPAATAPALVWAQCGIGAADPPVLAQRIDEAIADIDSLWGPMTTLMGQPIGDATIPGDPTEKNDGKLDIYIVDYSTTLRGRDLDPGTNRGVAPHASPHGVPGRPFASSTYIVINGQLAGDGLELKDTIAHEFFHSLESAHNRMATVVGNTSFWMFEASAVWAEHQFVPENRYNEYGYFDNFRETALSLSNNSGKNPYYSWMWPLFMAQEKGPASIAAVWSAMETKSGFDALQSAVDNQLPFQNRFRDFALRVWDENLQKGDPIKPRFQAWANDFPLGRPSLDPAGRWHYKEDVHVDTNGDPPKEVQENLPSLWASYSTLKVDEDVGQVVVDFSGLTPTGALDVDALVEIKDKGWEKRKLPAGKTRFCRDLEADDVQNLIIVLSNHDKSPATTVSGKWTYQGLANECADLSGTLTITRTSVYNNAQGEPMWTRDEKLTATITVGMSADPDPFSGGGYIDAESSYQISRTTLERRQMGDCTASYGTKTNGSWLFTDQPVGADWENNITGFVDYDLEIVMLAIVVHYPYEATEDVCNMYTGTNEGVHDFFACTGADGFGGGITGKITEIDNAPDTVTFSCRQQGPAMDYTQQTISVSGTLTLADEQGSPAP